VRGGRAVEESDEKREKTRRRVLFVCCEVKLKGGERAKEKLLKGILSLFFGRAVEQRRGWGADQLETGG